MKAIPPAPCLASHTSIDLSAHRPTMQADGISLASRPRICRLQCAPLGAAAWCGLLVAAFAASGTWNQDADGTWNPAVPGPWQSGIVAQGAGSTANFNFNLTADRTVTLPQDLTIGDPVSC